MNDAALKYAPCSPYLNRVTRELPEACAEAMRRRGIATTPCAVCGLTERCCRARAAPAGLAEASARAARQRV